MNVEFKENKELQNLINKFNDRKQIWDSMEEYKEKSNQWINNQFNTLNIEEIEETMKKYENLSITLK